MIIQLCGLSGAGKTTIATQVKSKAAAYGIAVEIIDGDAYRKALCKDLGFSKEDRCENIRRLGFVASKLSVHGVVCIISAINPYEAVRRELACTYKQVRTVFVDCDLETLVQRDTKGLERALQDAGLKTDSGNLSFTLQQGNQGNSSDTPGWGTNGGRQAGSSGQEKTAGMADISSASGKNEVDTANGLVDVAV